VTYFSQRGGELFIGSTWASKEMMEHAYGTPDDLAELIASSAAGEIKRAAVARIKELRGQ
jgi:hypothetical protein